MHFMLFGHTADPVMQLLPQMRFRRAAPGVYRVAAPPELLDQAARSGIVGAPGPDPLLTERVVIFEGPAVEQIERAARGCLPAYQRAIAAAQPLIQQGYSQTAAAQSGIGWAQVQHTLMIGWLMDLCVPLALRRHGHAEQIDDWQVVGYTAYPQDSRGCGVRLYPGQAGLFGELWVEHCRRMPHLPLNLTPHEVTSLVRLHQRQSVEDPSLRKLCYFGVVHREDGGWRLAIPAFDQTERPLLLQPMLAAAQEIAAELSAVLDRLGDATPQGRLSRLTFLRLVLTLGLEALLHTQVLPAPPAAVPRSWGLWLTVGPDDTPLFDPFGTRSLR